MNRQLIFVIPILLVISVAVLAGTVSSAPIEKKILNHLASGSFVEFETDRRCGYNDAYVVYLIDNFEQRIQLIPEVTTSHGELVEKILVSGRKDIIVKRRNTSLCKGLAMVIDELLHGGCADAVISSIPGSNYTYRQISSLLQGEASIRRDNILDYQETLTALLKRIAYKGFPSAAWLERIDVNSFKLINDARKVVFAEALGRFKAPILIPYGNVDSNHGNEARTVNILSLVSHVMAFSALDQRGRRIKGYPYSPLSMGDERAIYQVWEIPDLKNPLQAHLDVNDDGFIDYTFRRSREIPFRDKRGLLSFAPRMRTKNEFKELKARLKNDGGGEIGEQVVLTAAQYRELGAPGLATEESPLEKEYVWLNPPDRDAPFWFNAVPWVRGLIRGTSLIPPQKVKELLSAATTSQGN